MENLLKHMNLGFMSVFSCTWLSLMMAHEPKDIGENMSYKLYKLNLGAFNWSYINTCVMQEKYSDYK